MVGKKQYEPRFLYGVSLDDLVAEDNFYRRLEKVIDLSFLYKESERVYGKTGKPSIDPVVFFKVLLYGYFENIISDRELIRKASDSLSARYYLGYDFDEQLPWHSTISRTRKLYDQSVFEKVFQEVLDKCIKSGLVEGEHQSVDSTLVKANASMDSLRRKVTITDFRKYVDETKRENEIEDLPGEEKKVKDDQRPKSGKGRATSNKEYESKTDPDSKIRKKGKNHTDLYYQVQYSVDSRKKVITDVLTTASNIRDSEVLPEVINRAQRRLARYEKKIKTLSADMGYFSGRILREIEKKSIIAYIPKPTDKNTGGRYGKIEFIYDKEKDVYRCPNQKELEYSHYQKDEQRHIYRSKEKDCSECRLKKLCTETKRRQVQRTIYTDEIERLEKRMTSREAKEAMYYRKTGPEHLFAEAKNYHGLKKFMTRGMSSAQKNSYMIATVQNIKRLLKAGKEKAIVLKEKVLTLREYFYKFIVMQFS